MRRAAIVSPIRTGVGRYLGALSALGAEELGALVIRDLMTRTGLDPERVDEVVFAQGYPSGEAPCIGRWAALAADLPLSVSGTQVDRRCGSGVQAIANAAMMVQTGVADVVIAGGAESMSNVEFYTTAMRQGQKGGSTYSRKFIGLFGSGIRERSINTCWFWCLQPDHPEGFLRGGNAPEVMVN